MSRSWRILVVALCLVALAAAYRGCVLSDDDVRGAVWQNLDEVIPGDFVTFNGATERLSGDTIYVDNLPVAIKVRAFRKFGRWRMVIRSLKTGRKGECIDI